MPADADSEAIQDAFQVRLKKSVQTYAMYFRNLGVICHILHCLVEGHFTMLGITLCCVTSLHILFVICQAYAVFLCHVLML